MSSLIFYHDNEQALVATDTLAVRTDGSPLMFSSKAIYLPHLRTIIAGTGVGAFSGEWAMHVNNYMVLSGIGNLDFHAPKDLRERWKNHISHSSLPPGMTTTVYCFGLSEIDQSMIGYAYRSTNDFQSERLKYGTGLKPECTLPEDLDLLRALPQMMQEQRENEACKPLNDRIHIGGECNAIHLTKDNCNIFQVFEFEDFREQLKQIFANHDATTAN